MPVDQKHRLTERRRGFEAFDDDETERYRLLVESVQDYAIFLLDPDGYVTTWNLGAQRFKGYKPEEIIGKHFSIFFTEEDLAAHKPERELETARQKGRAKDEYWRVRKDGSRFWADVVITALYDRSGRLEGYAKVTRDLTERKKNEDRLRDMNRELETQRLELEKLNVLKDEFVSLASHQLRTPATGVKQYLGLLLQGYAGSLTEQQEYYLQKAYSTNERQIDLINDLLRVAQVDGGKLALAKTLTDMSALAEDVVAGYADTFAKRSQRTHVQVSGDPIEAVADARQIRMVLENLVDNASKYTREGGEITVSVAMSRGQLHVRVADTGVGIPQDQIPRLFQKFSRLPNELSETVGGSGLGLYWASKVVGLHGGTIQVTSNPGKGTEFDVAIPAGLEPEPA
jgi:PAS domain S-box-containing protein